MAKIICNYNIELEDRDFKTDNEFKIIQIFEDSGNMEIGGKTYPISNGSLYFIGENTEYKIDVENCRINEIIIEEKYFREIATLLEFNEEFEELFIDNNGFYKNIKNYKTVDSKFKAIRYLPSSNKPMALALSTSKVLEIINYGVSDK